MTVTGISRLEDLIGIMYNDSEKPILTVKHLDEIQGILNQLPKDNDSTYILSTMFQGTNHRQANARLEVYKDDSNFLTMLEIALTDETIREKIREMVS